MGRDDVMREWAATSRRTKKELPPEYELQKSIIKWRNDNIIAIPELRWLHSSGNGARMMIQQAAMQKASGMTKGVWDLFWPLKRSQYSGLYIECKATTNLTEEQSDFGFFVRLNGYFTYVIRDLMTATKIILGYEALERNPDNDIFLK